MIVTANPALRRIAEREAEAGLRGSGASAWIRPDILTWQGLLRRVYFTCLDSAGADLPAPLLLNSEQARVLWESAIAGDGEDVAAGMAGLAQSGWRVARTWQLTPRQLEQAAGYEDARAFARWSRRYAEHCGRRGYLDVDALPDWLAAQALPAPGPGRLRGVDTGPTSIAALLEPLALQIEPVAAPPVTVQRRGFDDAEAELVAAATWIGERMSADPGASVALVVPNLAQRYGDVARVLDDVLLPGARRSDVAPWRRPWLAMSGMALADAPILRRAETLLRLEPGRNPWTRISALLRDVDAGALAGQADACAALDLQLRRANYDQVPLDALCRRVAEQPGLAELSACLDAIRSRLQAAPRRQGPAAWLEEFLALLQHWGWPGGATLAHPDTARLLDHWQEAIEIFASLELVSGALTRGQALDRLVALLRSRRLDSDGDSGLAVVDAGDALDIRARYLWFAGLDENAWPPPERGHALIGLKLLERRGAPVSVARRLEMYQHRQQRILAGASEAIVSWCRDSGQAALAPSPLIAGIAAGGEALPVSAGIPLDWRQVAAATALEDWRDPAGPVLAPGSTISGGTAAINDQSACPFRAFARHRLRAVGLVDPVPGLNPLERGTLVHHMLHAFWSRCPDLASLRAMPARPAAVREAAADALETFERQLRRRLPDRLRALEADRLAALLLRWLEMEEGRADFAIAHLEHARGIELAGYTLNGRADRVDRLASGGALVIDYKTGKVSAADWFGERPANLQLPLYALGDETISGIAYAQLRADDLAWRGIMDADSVQAPFKAALLPWPEQVASWRGTVHELAEAFGRGEAAVDPQPYACTFCDLPMLCRVTGQRVGEQADDDA